MKTVFPNAQLTHVWAQQTQHSGRSGSMSFEGPTLYSYKTPIAKFYTLPTSGRVVLATSETYSITTSSKHMPALWRALMGLGSARVFRVPFIELDPSKARLQGMGRVGTHLQNLDAIVARYVATRESELRHIKVYRSAYDRLEPIQRDARAYAQIFGLPVPTLDARADSDGIERIRAERKAKRETPAYLAAQARKAELAAARDAKRAAERVLLETERRTAWQAGAANMFYGTDEKGGAYLRLSNDGTRVETSRGAFIPTADARRIIPLIRACKEAGEVFEPYDRAAYAVGSFQVNRVDANGDIKAGCHFIQFAEIDKIGKLLGV